MPAVVPTLRTILFVPASRPDRIPKALATGADAVCVDLEDGVAPAAKAVAREQALAFFADPPARRPLTLLRVNEPGSAYGREDLEALLRARVRPDAVMVPKVGAAADVRTVAGRLAEIDAALPLVAQIETAAGVAHVREIASASDQVAVLFFGAIDLAADLGCAVDWDALLHARSEIVLAAALAGVDAVDTPFMNVPALDRLAEECRRTRRLGFVGKAAIHPTQVPVIQTAFRPTVEEVDWARRIVDAYDRNEGGVLLVDGQLIERPVIRAARRTLRTVGEDPGTRRV